MAITVLHTVTQPFLKMVFELVQKKYVELNFQTMEESRLL